MNGWFVVAALGITAAQWIALWWAYRTGFLEAIRLADEEWSAEMDAEREVCLRTLAAQRERHEREGLTVLFGPHLLGRPSKARWN